MDLRSKIRLCADLFMVVLYHTDIYSWDNSIIKGVSAYFREYFRHTLYLMSPVFFFKEPYSVHLEWLFFFFCVKIKTTPLSFYLLKKKIPWWILVPWFSLSLYLVMHLRVISVKRWRVPGLALWRSWPWHFESCLPPFPSSTPFISGNSYGASLKLVYFPLRGPYCCQAPSGVCGPSFNTLSWLAALNTAHFCTKQLLSLSRQLRRALT